MHDGSRSGWSKNLFWHLTFQFNDISKSSWFVKRKNISIVVIKLNKNLPIFLYFLSSFLIGSFYICNKNGGKWNARTTREFQSEKCQIENCRGASESMTPLRAVTAMSQLHKDASTIAHISEINNRLTPRDEADWLGLIDWWFDKISVICQFMYGRRLASVHEHEQPWTLKILTTNYY